MQTQVALSPLTWPTPDMYQKWQERTLSTVNQALFFDLVFPQLLRQLDRRFHSLLSPQDIEECALTAVQAHADSFGKGREVPEEVFERVARAHLRTIALRTGSSALRYQFADKRFGDEFSLDVTDDDIQRELHSHGALSSRDLDETSLQEILTFLERATSGIWVTVRLWIEWSDYIATADSIEDFLEFAEKRGHTLAKSTVYRHLADGAAQIERWLTLDGSPE